MRRLPARDPAQRSCQVQHRAGFSTRDVRARSSAGRELPGQGDSLSRRRVRGRNPGAVAHPRRQQGVARTRSHSERCSQLRRTASRMAFAGRTRCDIEAQSPRRRVRARKDCRGAPGAACSPRRCFAGQASPLRAQPRAQLGHRTEGMSDPTAAPRGARAHAVRDAQDHREDNGTHPPRRRPCCSPRRRVRQSGCREAPVTERRYRDRWRATYDSTSPKSTPSPTIAA